MDDIWAQLGIKRTSAQIRNSERRIRVYHIQFKLPNYFPWMGWPVLGYVYDFWSNIMEEGIYSTIKPRWGMITFGYLNDGFKPTVWHTMHEVIYHGNGPYSGIYPSGAPKSLKEAKGDG